MTTLALGDDLNYNLVDSNNRGTFVDVTHGICAGCRCAVDLQIASE